MTVSVLVPFRADSSRDVRHASWNWIRRRWESMLPEAELCIGTDDGGQPFSKAAAVNDAYYRSSGDMLCIVDADSWVDPGAVYDGIRIAANREHLVVPWWKAYRFTKADSQQIMASDPENSDPVTPEMKKRAAGTGPSPASAAMVLCIQRRSFERVGGWDPRFRGWGSEDVSFGLACWTLLGRNEYTLGEAFALYHPQPTNAEGMRIWKHDAGLMNMPLYERYADAQANPDLMSILCQEHPLAGAATPIGPAPTLRPEDLVAMPGREQKFVTAPIVQEEY